MAFEKINGLSTDTIEEKRKEEIKKEAQIIGELDYWATKNGNPLVFEDSNLKDKTKIDEGVRLDKKYFRNLTMEDIKLFREYFKNLKSFIKGPIFTDNFHMNHRDPFNENNFTRYDWERIYLKELSPEAKEYYESNRLNFSKCYNVIRYVDEMKNLITNFDVKDKLSKFQKNIPVELTEEKDEVYEYSLLEDKKKIDVVRKLTEVIKDVILLLGKKEEK